MQIFIRHQERKGSGVWYVITLSANGTLEEHVIKAILAMVFLMRK